MQLKVLVEPEVQRPRSRASEKIAARLVRREGAGKRRHEGAVPEIRDSDERIEIRYGGRKRNVLIEIRLPVGTA